MPISSISASPVPPSWVPHSRENSWARPRYMSPEQAESLPLDHRSDLYALGLIIYEMVTGDLPFESDTVMQAMYQRVTQAPKNPKLLNPELPDYLCKIILTVWKRIPSSAISTPVRSSATSMPGLALRRATSLFPCRPVAILALSAHPRPGSWHRVWGARKFGTVYFHHRD